MHLRRIRSALGQPHGLRLWTPLHQFLLVHQCYFKILRMRFHQRSPWTLLS
jgi:hypothetical protein